MRKNVEQLRVPLDEGIVTNATNHQIGHRLKEMLNAAWGYKRQGPFVETIGLGRPAYPANFITMSNCEQIFDIDFFKDSTTGTWYTIATGLRTSDGNPGAWAADTGVELPNNPFPAGIHTSLLYFGDISPSTMFAFSENAITTDIVKLEDIITGFVAYAPTGLPVATTRAMKAYQKRLWIGLTEGTQSFDQLWYSNVYDSTIFRTGAFYRILGRITCLFRTTASDIDSGGGAHLVVGCEGSIHVIDGVPEAGNDLLRTLTDKIGIVRDMYVETPTGAFFMGSDRVIYYMAPGATNIQPISTPIGDRVPDSSVACLGYEHPNLLLFSDITDLYIYNVWRQTWSGRHAIGNGSLLPDILFRKVGYANNYPQNSAVVNTYVGDQFRGNVWQISPLADFTFDRWGFQTGYINKPSMHVAFSRAILEIENDTEAELALFSVFLLVKASDGTTKEVQIPVFEIAAGASQTVILTMGAENIQGDWIQVTLSSYSPTLLKLRTFDVEVKWMEKQE